MRTYIPIVLDLFSEILLDVGLMEPLESARENSCQEGEDAQIAVSDWEGGEINCKFFPLDPLQFDILEIESKKKENSGRGRVLGARPRYFRWTFEKPTQSEYEAMIKKKTKSKTTTKKSGKKRNAKKDKELNPVEVRKDIAQIVKSAAPSMTQAVIDEGEKGQLATVNYWFEMASIYPPLTDGSYATADEDGLAQTLLHRSDIPDKPIALDEEDEPAISGKNAAETKPDEKEADGQTSEQERVESETAGRANKVVPAVV
ncbi:MAG: hypothetical protein WA830_02005 [Candidatus Sulfotelmatobacter sp.]